MSEPIKSCMNCAYRKGSFDWGKCLATGEYPDIERKLGKRCGADWKLWAPRPGVITRFLDWLLG